MLDGHDGHNVWSEGPPVSCATRFRVTNNLRCCCCSVQQSACRLGSAVSHSSSAPPPCPTAVIATTTTLRVLLNVRELTTAVEIMITTAATTGTLGPCRPSPPRKRSATSSRYPSPSWPGSSPIWSASRRSWNRSSLPRQNRPESTTPPSQASKEAQVRRLPRSDTEAYYAAAARCPDQLTRKRKMLFLKANQNDLAGAAANLAEYWKTRVEVFGDDRAYLPMTLAGAMKDEKINLASRCVWQLLPRADTAGRPMLFFCPGRRNFAEYTVEQEMVRAMCVCVCVCVCVCHFCKRQ